VLEGRVCVERKIREGRRRKKKRRYFIPVLIRRHPNRRNPALFA